MYGVWKAIAAAEVDQGSHDYLEARMTTPLLNSEGISDTVSEVDLLSHGSEKISLAWSHDWSTYSWCSVWFCRCRALAMYRPEKKRVVNDEPASPHDRIRTAPAPESDSWQGSQKGQ